MQAHLTKLKRLPKYKHWYNLNSQAIQDIVDRVDRAYALFFRNIKQGIKVRPPNFKKRKYYKSFTLKQTGYKLIGNNKIKIGKLIFKYSNGEDIQSPLFFKQNRSKIRKAHKQLSSKVKGSNNRRKSVANLNRVYREINNQRDDFQWKLANSHGSTQWKI